MNSIFDELPAPPKPVLTDEQRYRRHRRFAVVLNAFVLAYSLIHKFFLPVYLTRIAHASSFAPVDGWWLYHLALAVLLLRKNWDDAALRSTLFFGIGGAACQILVSFRERNWHSVSLWVTSASTLWVIFFLLSKTRGRLPARWGGGRAALKAVLLAAGFLAQFAFFGFTLTVEKAAHRAAAKAVTTEAFPFLADPKACGAGGFRLVLEAGVPKLPKLGILREVSVRDCGFPAALAAFDPNGPLSVANATSGYLNVKAYVPSNGRWRPLQNMPLPPGLSHVLSPEALAGQGVILLASDADPKKGILLLLSDPAAFAEAVKSLPRAGEPGAVAIDRTGLSLR
ncbi:MAG TPA: hypothetical protein VFX30_12020 [bacterium]|nr:hypothetical protein [bacterium]